MAESAIDHLHSNLHIERDELNKQVDPPSLAGFLLRTSERPSCFHFI